MDRHGTAAWSHTRDPPTPGRADQGAGPLAGPARRRAYLLPTAAPPRPARYVPHIYPDRELAALFTQTDHCHYFGNVGHNFRRFLWQARISHGGRGHGPRVHDLRHTYAVNNLRLWFAQGHDVGALLPVLQTYLGHSSLADTAYYLHLTAESYPDITARVQQAIGDIVPPVTAGPRHGH